jgi:hypothetical protein
MTAFSNALAFFGAALALFATFFSSFLFAAS